MGRPAGPNVFFAFRDSSERRAALTQPPGGRERYRLFGLDALAESEVDWLRNWLAAGAPPVAFVPFGVDAGAFRPEPGREPDVDVVSIGADPRRDFELLEAVASRRPELTFRIVATADRARSL